MIMSGGHYELVRRDEDSLKSQTGLELDVVDHHWRQGDVGKMLHLEEPL